MQTLLNTHCKKTLPGKVKFQFGQLAKTLLGAVNPQDQAQLPRQYNFDAHVFNRHYASTHYGIMIPDLPEPYRYLSFASIIGDIGTKVTHTPMKLTGLIPENTATLVHGTAVSHNAEAYRIYNAQDDLNFQQSPFRVDYEQDASLYEQDGVYHLRSNLEDLAVELTLTPTPAITWFSHSVFYQHFSVLMQYSGYLIQQGEKIEIAGLCTLEHWKAVARSMLPSPLQSSIALLPLDSFSYQVINLDDERQLVLAYVGFAGQPCYTAVSYRHVDGTSIQFDGDVHFQVIALKTEPQVTPDEHVMELPQSFRWIAHHDGEKVLDILAVADTDYCYGLGAGYVSAFQWSGLVLGADQTGRGYIEYIDRR